MIGLKPYSDRIALAVRFQVCILDSDGPRSERGRKTDLRQNVSFSQICAHLGARAGPYRHSHYAHSETPKPNRNRDLLSCSFAPRR